MSYVEEFCDEIAIINKGEIVLSGNLKNIKKDFGKNRLILSANNMSLEELSNFAAENFADIVKVYETKKSFIVLELCDGKSKNDLLEKILTTDIDIEKFAEYEPTLTDIFVLKAGDE